MQLPLPARPIVGYRALSNESHINIGTLRAAACESRLPLRRYRIGTQVVFDADEVDRWKQNGAPLRGKAMSSC